MRLLRIGSPLLRRRAKNIDTTRDKELADQAIRHLAQHLRRTNALAVAAPQIGIDLRLFVKAVPPPPPPNSTGHSHLAVLNPVLLSASTKTADDWEACLSMDGYRVRVTRPRTVEVAYENLDGSSERKRLAGTEARVFLHELDHLDGVLHIDRADPRDVVHEDELSHRRWADLESADARAQSVG